MANEEYIKDNFIYNGEDDTYTHVQDERHNTKKCSRNPESKSQIYKNTKHVKNAKNKDKCTMAKNGRIIKRSPYQEIYDEVDKRTLENQELYKQRQMIVEHPFGTVKRTLGFSYFLTRGNENVKAESYMHFFTYNLIRVINIIGIKELIKILRDKKRLLFVIFCRYAKFWYNLYTKFQIILKETEKQTVFTQSDVPLPPFSRLSNNNLFLK